MKTNAFGLKSPSPRHIRDPHSVIKLAQEIVRRIDRGNSIWRMWDGQREVLLKSAVVGPDRGQRLAQVHFLAWVHLALCSDQHSLLKALAAVR
jgi:hypothetical protein